MNLKRVKLIGKLVLLFGTPVAIILGLFSCGTYVGAQHRHAITSFEKEWLGLDVEVAPEYPRPPEADAEETDDSEHSAESEDTADASEPAAQPAGDEPSREADDAGRDDAVARDPVRPESDDAREPPPKREPVPAVTPAPEPKTDPLDGALADRLATPLIVELKVLVDGDLIDARSDWIDYVQRTVSRASDVFEKQFGIELELAGVMQWSVATEGMDAQQLLDDVRRRPREGADILLGFTARPFDATTAGVSDMPEGGATFNGAYGVVYATPDHRNAHVRTLLHETARLFGASDITDPGRSEWVAGSWMSYARVPETQTPWIDAANRARVLERKDKPFRPESEETSR